MNETNEQLDNEIRAALADTDLPLSANDLLPLCPTASSREHVGNRLFKLKTLGEITCVERGKYRPSDVRSKPSDGRSQPQSPLTHMPAPPRLVVERAPRKEAAAVAPASAREILERLVADTQGALDAYLMSVGDAQIIAPLKAARDQARLALAHVNQGEAA